MRPLVRNDKLDNVYPLGTVQPDATLSRRALPAEQGRAYQDIGIDYHFAMDNRRARFAQR